MWSRIVVLSAALALAGLGCSASSDGGVLVEDDASMTTDGGGGGHDAQPDRGNGEGGTTTPDQCNNGLDDNGNGQVDENCPCTPGTSQQCYPGPMAQIG